MVALVPPHLVVDIVLPGRHLLAVYRIVVIYWPKSLIADLCSTGAIGVRRRRITRSISFRATSDVEVGWVSCPLDCSFDSSREGRHSHSSISLSPSTDGGPLTLKSELSLPSFSPHASLIISCPCLTGMSSNKQQLCEVMSQS